MTVGPAESAQPKRAVTPAQRASLAKARAARGRPSGDTAPRSRQRKQPLRTAPSDAGTLIRRGQPSKVLDPQIQGQILGVLRIGGTYDLACEVAGITPRTFEKWRARAADYGDEELEDVPPPERNYVKFVRQARLARSAGEVRYLAQIQMASTGRPGKMTNGEDGIVMVEPPILPDYRAAAWMLEHLHAEKYGRNYRINPEQREQVIQSFLQTVYLAMQQVGIDDETRKALGKAILGLAAPA